MLNLSGINRICVVNFSGDAKWWWAATSWDRLLRRLFDSSTNLHTFCPCSRMESSCSNMAVCQNLVPLVNIKIAGKWMFIPLKMVCIGIDPSPHCNLWQHQSIRTKFPGYAEAIEIYWEWLLYQTHVIFHSYVWFPESQRSSLFSGNTTVFRISRILASFWGCIPS